MRVCPILIAATQVAVRRGRTLVSVTARPDCPGWARNHRTPQQQCGLAQPFPLSNKHPRWRIASETAEPPAPEALSYTNRTGPVCRQRSDPFSRSDTRRGVSLCTSPLKLHLPLTSRLVAVAWA